LVAERQGSLREYWHYFWPLFIALFVLALFVIGTLRGMFDIANARSTPCGRCGRPKRRRIRRTLRQRQGSLWRERVRVL